MANSFHIQIVAHSCEEFENAMRVARVPKNENGNMGSVPAVILRDPKNGWVLRFIDAIEMPCSFCPFCGKELPDG